MRYYSTRRPITPGGYPKKEAVKEIKNFDTKIFLEEAGMEVWGYIEYTEPLPEKDAEAYELVPGGLKTFWAVTTSFDDRGGVVSDITGTVQAAVKPENTSVSERQKDVYTDWFDSREEARAWVKRAKKS